jgi:hypothetical protein
MKVDSIALGGSTTRGWDDFGRCKIRRPREHRREGSREPRVPASAGSMPNSTVFYSVKVDGCP